MKRRWQFAPGVDADLAGALRERFDPGHLAPAPGVPERRIGHRGYGVLARGGALALDVFVKVFVHDSPGRRLRRLLGRSGADREFASAVRLHEVGLAVARPLARVDEGAATYLLSEFIAGARALGACLEGDEAAPWAARAGRLLADLAARGSWHRDARPDNLLAAPADAARPERIVLVDVRHVDFSAPGDAAERMLVSLAAFFLVEGRDEAAVVRFVASAAEAAGLGAAAAGAILEAARAFARDLVVREVRKGKRSASDLEVFTWRYAAAADAATYCEARFARSRHQRKVEAAERRIVEAILRECDVRGSVLDVPCGAGRFLSLLAARARPVVGADASGPMLELARAAAEPPRPCVRCDARRLPFADGAFELVFTMRLLHRVRHRDERAAVLKELARASRRWVLFSFYNRRSLRGLRSALRGRYAGETRGRIAAEAAEAGLSVERFIPVGPLARQTLVSCRTVL